MATAATCESDARYVMEKLRGQYIHLNGKPIGLVVVPYIDDHCIMAKISINNTVDLQGKFIRFEGDLFKMKFEGRNILSIVDTHPDKRLNGIKVLD